MLKAAAATGAALWVTPTVLALDASPAAASSCTCAGGVTMALTFLTAVGDTLPNPVPTICGTPAGGSSGAKTICLTDSTKPVYLWGSGTGSSGSNNPPNGPLFDDMGIVTVTDSASVTRYGNIYRFQNFCRHGTNVPTNLVSGYSASVQRVYTGLDANTWDYLPPQPATNPAETATPTSWWTASQPNAAGTQSTGNPGFTTATPWPGPIDISLLFGGKCGTFTVTVTDQNRYQQFKWSNIFIGTTPAA